MKRNVALFLVGILMFSYVPTNAFGKQYSTDDNVQRSGTKKVLSGLSRSPIPVQPRTLFVEPGAVGEEAGGTIQGNNDVEAWVNGGYFEITVPGDQEVTYPMRLTIELNNAEWYFRNDAGVKVIKNGSIDGNIYTPEKKDYRLELSRANLNTATLIIDKEGSGKQISSKPVNNINNILSNIRNIINEENGLEYTLNKVNIKTNDSNNNMSAIDELNNLKTIINSIKNSSKSISESDKLDKLISNDGRLRKLQEYLINLKKLNYDDLKTYLNVNNQSDLEKINNGVISLKDSLNSLNSEIESIENSDQDNSKTTEKTYQIPLVVRTLTENEDSTVRLLSSSSLPVETEKRVFAIGTQSGLTTAIVRSPVTSRTNFDIEAIGIKENRISAFKPSGAFELVAPSGYEFRMKDAKLTAEGGIGPIENVIIRHKNNVNNNSNNMDYSTVQVIYSGLKPSTDITGSLAITGLSLLDMNNESVREQDLYINIRNLTGDFKINNKNVTVTDNTVTAQSILVGYVRDWRVALTSVGIVPTLVNGRLDGTEMQNVSDQDHKAVTVRFEEQVKNAWWSERVTKLSLPQGIKVRKATFERIRNISETDLNGTFYNNRNIGSGTGRVRIDDNIITLSGITSKGEKASFDLNLWLSIEPGFTGNVDLKLSGSAVTDNDRNAEDKGVVIAKVVNPIEVKAELTDAKVGYQYFTVGNFTITETAAGRLKSNEDVYISITDNTSAVMQISPSFKWEITKGDIRVKNMTTGSQTQLGNLVTNKMNGAHISFGIDRQSTVASQISFKDVQVRLNNNYNSSGINKYDLIVWGPAVANNYRGLIDYNKNNNLVNNNININDYFFKPGISVPYIQSVGSTDNISTIKNIVKVTVGNPIILVNNRQVAMPTAAYISQISNSTMVPVRFISTGLGIDESKVIWDESTGTITIDAGNRIIQMKTNSDIITINGVEIPMLSPEGSRVTVEVKDNRAFVPFRTLGEAFGIPVGWNPLTSTATYNDNSVDMTKNYIVNQIEDMTKNNKEIGIIDNNIVKSTFDSYNIYE